MLFVVVDQTPRGTVMIGNQTRLFQFGQDRFGKLLAEFHTPLIETIDIPDDSLGKNLMFVKSDQGAKGAWCQLLKQEAIGRFVACKDFVRYQHFQFLTTHALRCQLGADFCSGLPTHQGFRLREEVG